MACSAWAGGGTSNSGLAPPPISTLIKRLPADLPTGSCAKAVFSCASLLSYFSWCHSDQTTKPNQKTRIVRIMPGNLWIVALLWALSMRRRRCEIPCKSLVVSSMSGYLSQSHLIQSRHLYMNYMDGWRTEHGWECVGLGRLLRMESSTQARGAKGREGAIQRRNRRLSVIQTQVSTKLC